MAMTPKITFPELEVWFLLVLMIGADAAHMMFKNCSHIALNVSVLHLGNPLRATLLPRCEACTVDYMVSPIDVVWQLDKEEILRSRYSALNDQVLTVTIPSFNQLKGNLTCSVLHNGSLQLLQWAEVRAGYPPMKPRLLLCKSYWTSFAIQSIVCNWDPGSETHLETNYTLHVSETIGKCATRYLTPKNCTTSMPNNSCMVLVSNLVSYHDIWVTAVNALGTQMSNHKCLDGMLIVKFRAPQIIEVTLDAEQNGCLIGQWMMPFEMTDHSTAAFEIRYKALDDERWIQVPLTMINSRFFRLCHLLPYTEYQLKIRCKQKTETSPWSEWSNDHTGITAESVPTQKLQLWRSIKTPNAEGIRRVHLMWKPLKKTAANGKILGYRVWLHKPELRVYNTSISERFLHLPDGDYRIQVSAYNSVGESPKAAIVIPSSEKLGLPSMSHVLAFSNGNNSLLVQWEPPSVPTTGYVVEWCVVSEKIACSINWQNVAANVTEVTIQDTIEPMQLYNISVYPIFEDLPGFPSSTRAYSKEGAPRRSPEIRSKQIWKTKVHLEWKELPIDDQNGFIKNYTILYKNRNGKLKSVVIDGSEHNCILTDLLPNTEYDVTIVASTDAGNATGYNLVVTTKMIDDGEVELFLICIFSFSLFLSLALIATCIYQRQRIQKHFWPNIPDPANSTLAHWMPKTLRQDVRDLQGDPNPMTQIQVVCCDGPAKSHISETKYYWLQGKSGDFPTIVMEANISIKQTLQDSSAGQDEINPRAMDPLAPEYHNVTVNDHENVTFADSSNSASPLYTCSNHVIPHDGQSLLSLMQSIPDDSHGKTLLETTRALDKQEMLCSFPFLMNLHNHMSSEILSLNA